MGIADSKHLPLPSNGFNVCIINYDVLNKYPQIKEEKWDLLVCDECHKLKNEKTIRGYFVYGGTQKIKVKGLPDKEIKHETLTATYKLFLTGTPICNRPSELFPIISYLDPITWKNKWRYFMSRYCNMVQTRFGCDNKGANPYRLPELQKILRRTIMVRRLKSEVLTDLPPKTRQIIEIEPTPEMEQYILAENEAAKEKEDLCNELKAKIELAKAGSEEAYRNAVKALQAFTQVSFEEVSRLRHETALVKVPAVIDDIQGIIETDQKVVVFAHHKDVVEKICDEFPGICVKLTGDVVKMEDRQKAVDRFQTDNGCMVFVGSITAAGVGITLTAASTVTFAEEDWVPGNITQCEDRCIVKDSLVFCLPIDYINSMSMIKIQNAKIGDRVLTHLGNYKTVVDINTHEHRGMVTRIEYVGWSEPLACTYDHKIFIKREGSCKWVRACDTLPSDSMAFPKQKKWTRLESVKIKPEWRLYKTGEKPTKCTFENCDKPIEARGLCRIHYRSLISGLDRPKKPEQINSRYVRLPDEIEINDDWLYLFGWFAAEGFSSLLPGKSKFVSFSGHEKEEQTLKKIACILNGLGIKSYIYRKKGEHGIEMRSYSGELSLWFRAWFGHTAKNKTLPKEILDLPPDQAAIFLKGYTDGDGYQRKRQVEWVSASPVMCYQMCELAIRSGFIPTMRPVVVKNNTLWVGGYTKFSKCDNARLRDQDENYVYRPIKRVETKNEITEVYDLTVEEDHSFTVGFATVHNCHRIGQKFAVNVRHVVLAGSIDSKMVKMTVEKQEIIELALDKEVEQIPVTPGEQASTIKTSRQSIEQEAILMSAEQVEAIHDGLRYLAACCDGARSQDGSGFNKIDTYIGKSLASSYSLSAKQAVLGKRLTTKYKRQLPEGLRERIFGKQEEVVDVF